MSDDAVDVMLSANEARVLGCLMEKQATTPEYYPLTLKALTAACNQKSSRVPVMSLSEGQVGGVVNGLRTQGLVTARMDGRVDRFEHHLSRKLGITSKERAIICVLMLRSLLTLNEIRINTNRMVEFESNDEIQAVLDGLMGRDEPLVIRIPRGSSQREDRFAQLLCGEPDIEIPQRAASPSPSAGNADSNRIAQLENEVAELKAELQRLYDLTGFS